MHLKSVYKFLLFGTMFAGVTGAGIGCYYLMKSKEETRQNAIERSSISYQVRPAYQFKIALEDKNAALAIDLLSSADLDPNHPYCKEHANEAKSGENPLLIEVVYANMPTVLEKLLKQDINLFAPSCEGKTAIEESIRLNYVEMLDLLLKKSQIDINALYQQTGETLLHLAINAQAKDVIHFLLHHGADVWTKNQKGIPAIAYEENEKAKEELLQLFQTIQKTTNPQGSKSLPTPVSHDPIAPVIPATVAEVASADVAEVAPADVAEVAPTDVAEVTPTDVAEVTPTDVAEEDNTLSDIEAQGIDPFADM